MTLLTGIAGLWWGLPYAYWLSSSPYQYQVFLIIGLLTLSTGAMYAYFIHLPLLYAFEITYLIPACLVQLFGAGSVHQVSGAAAVLYLATTLAFAHRMHRTQLESLRIRFENDELMQRLAVEKSLAESSNLEKSKFLASASHDLRQPTHALSLFSGLLHEQTLDAGSREIAGHISRATAALGNLFDGLMDLSMLDTGVIRPRYQHFSLDELLEQLHTEYLPRASKKNLRLRLCIAGEQIAHSDPALVGRIVRNIVDNAVRHTQTGGVLIACRKRGDSVRVEVWDTGPGIARSEQEKIFLEFHQIGNPERDRSKGLGLGLAIVRRTAELLKHPLTVRSTPGKGSVFALSVPLGDAGKVKAEWTSLAPTHTAQQLVLVVEDDLANLEGLSGLLEVWGYRVLAGRGARDVLAAMNLLDPPSVILTDYRLNGTETGFEVIDRLRAAYLDDNIPALIMTGDTAPQLVVTATRRGWMLLHKPVDPSMLRKVVMQSIALRNQTPASSAG